MVFQSTQIIANSEKMRAAVRLAERVAPTDATVLATGESGTGKNLICDLIHRKSKRQQYDLIKIDCAALPPELLEAELFGFERGAFTGASARKAGRLEAAHNSTLLLDEIALLPLAAQAKLLRVLEEREFNRLGGGQRIKIDVRVLATTNVDLRLAIERKMFREDLFFRLNVVEIHLPPLRERTADLTDLTCLLTKFFAAKHGRKISGLLPEAISLLKNYDFPGNVRELANLIERAVLSGEGEKLTVQDFPLQSAARSVWQTLAEVEAAHIRQTLETANGNKSKAAKMLGISRKNLYERLARLAAE
jgi:transcriptional regulator with PAS, ATPase and Fis domain